MKRIPDHKNIIIFLSMRPEDGGKFQYSLSILNALSSICFNKYKVTAVFHIKDWIKYVPDNIEKIEVHLPNLISKIFRKIILLIPFGLIIWRVVGKYLDPIHKCLHNLKPNLIFYPGNDSYAYKVNLPSCIPIFDLMHRYEKDFPEVSDRRIYKNREYHYKNVSKYAKAILVDSEVGRKQFLECYKVRNDKVYVLPYIAPPYIISKCVSKCAEIDIINKYNLPEKYIFYPAQFWAHKNHIGLLKAILLLKKKNILINAVFVGSSKNAGEEIKNAIEELGLKNQIIILEYVSNDELLLLYKNATALVMPTFFGPTNIPPLEAFALGCPVLISNVYAIPEQVRDAALLFDPRNIRDIAERIEMIWNDKKLMHCLIEKGYRMDRFYSAKNFNHKLLKILRIFLN